MGSNPSGMFYSLIMSVKDIILQYIYSNTLFVVDTIVAFAEYFPRYIIHFKNKTQNRKVVDGDGGGSSKTLLISQPAILKM